MTKMEIPNYVQMCHKLRAEKLELQKRIDRMEAQRRERFAMAAMQGIASAMYATEAPTGGMAIEDFITEQSLKIADALIAELDKEVK